jgi:hypothetical protein
MRSHNEVLEGDRIALQEELITLQDAVTAEDDANYARRRGASMRFVQRTPLREINGAYGAINTPGMRPDVDMGGIRFFQSHKFPTPPILKAMNRMSLQVFWTKVLKYEAEMQKSHEQLNMEPFDLDLTRLVDAELLMSLAKWDFGKPFADVNHSELRELIRKGLSSTDAQLYGDPTSALLDAVSPLKVGVDGDYIGALRHLMTDITRAAATCGFNDSSGNYPKSEGKILCVRLARGGALKISELSCTTNNNYGDVVVLQRLHLFA